MLRLVLILFAARGRGLPVRLLLEMAAGAPDGMTGYMGSQSFGASSNVAKSNPGATVHPTKVQSPVLSADCQISGGMIACGCSPAATSGPSLKLHCPSSSAILRVSALPA